MKIAFTCLLIIFFYVYFRSIFKIAYYEQTLELNNMEDSVKDMPLYKLWIN